MLKTAGLSVADGIVQILTVLGRDRSPEVALHQSPRRLSYCQPTRRAPGTTHPPVERVRPVVDRQVGDCFGEGGRASRVLIDGQDAELTSGQRANGENLFAERGCHRSRSIGSEMEAIPSEH